MSQTQIPSRIIFCPACGAAVRVPDDGGQYQVGWCYGRRVAQAAPQIDQRRTDYVTAYPIAAANAANDDAAGVLAGFDAT